MNLLILILMCIRAALAAPLAALAWRLIDWDRPDVGVLLRAVLLAGLTGGYWGSTFIFLIDPAPAEEAARRLMDTALSLALLAAFIRYRRRWLV